MSKTGNRAAVVIDNGTGYTKMGFAGNVEPQYIIPTVTASKTDVDSMKGKRDGVEDLDFFIGDKALNNNSTHQINYPIRGGIIDNWDNMERLWSRCLFEYLRCDPEEHYVRIGSSYHFFYLRAFCGIHISVQKCLQTMLYQALSLRVHGLAFII
jgi:actin-related protein